MSIDNTQGQAKVSNPFAVLATHQYLLLKTFRKDGAAVATPVWFAYGDGALYVMTTASTGKVKRIRNNSHVTMTPCDRAGKVIGDGKEIEGDAHELPAGEYTQAIAIGLLAHKYGLFYKLFTSVMNLRKVKRTYIEITPAS